MALQRVDSDSTTTDAETYKSNDIDSDGDGIVNEADHAATAGDAETLDGNDSSAFADSGHSHDQLHDRYTDSEATSAVDGSTIAALTLGDQLTVPVFASTSDVPAQPEGSVVYISGDGLFVEDGT